MPYHVVNSVAEALNQRQKSVKGARLLILGVAYKKDVDDTRESPALKIMQLLEARGAAVDYSDPHIPQLYKMRHYDYAHKRSVALTAENLGGYDGVVIVTDHSRFDYAAIVQGAQLVVDTRNATRHVTQHRERIVLC